MQDLRRLAESSIYPKLRHSYDRTLDDNGFDCNSAVRLVRRRPATRSRAASSSSYSRVIIAILYVSAAGLSSASAMYEGRGVRRPSGRGVRPAALNRRLFCGRVRRRLRLLRWRQRQTLAMIHHDSQENMSITSAGRPTAELFAIVPRDESARQNELRRLPSVRPSVEFVTVWRSIAPTGNDSNEPRRRLRICRRRWSGAQVESRVNSLPDASQEPAVRVGLDFPTDRPTD